jgi:hypothetical protein
MIRKSIIAVLLTCTIATGALWAAGYWRQPTWTMGDGTLRHNRTLIVASLEVGTLVTRIEQRGEWKAGPLSSRTVFFRPSRIDVVAGIYYEFMPGERSRQPDMDDEYIRDEDGLSRTPGPLPITPDASTLSINDSGQVWRTYPEGAHGTQLNWIEYTTATSTWTVWIPLWIPCLLFGIYPTLALTRAAVVRHRRRRNGLCLRCGYDLTGNVSGVCSECGRGVNADRTAAGGLHR